jgi:hypothetical protein
MLRPLHAALVESAWGAVPVLPSVRFPRPLSEPAVRVSTQRALHGICRQAGFATVQGLGIVLPR